MTAVLALATAVMLRPTVEQLRTAVPDNLGDPTLIAWLLSWVGQAFTSDPTSYYDAPNFWPAADTLTYSDSLLPLAVVFTPVYALTENWALALNATVVGLFMSNLLASYSLVRWLTGSTGGAVVSALGFGFTTYFMSHLGNVQLLAAAGLPLGLLLLLKVLVHGRLRHAVAVGVLTCLIVLAAAYYAVVWAAMATTVAVGWVAVRRGSTGSRQLRAIVVAGVVAGVCTLPLVLPYLATQSDPAFARGLEPRSSLEVADLLTPASGSLLYGEQATRAAARGHEYRFFPGLLTAGFAVVGVAALRRRTPGAVTSRGGVLEQPRDRRLGMHLVLAAGLVCVLCSLGPTFMGHIAPFRVLYELAPGFSGVRVPARLAVGGLVAGALLVCLGVQLLTERLRPRWQWSAVAAASVVVLAELARTNTWATLPADPATLGVYEALSERPAGPAVELPMVDPSTNGPDYPYVESPRQLYASLDWHPRVNGYSGYVRPGYVADVQIINTFPSEAALSRLRELQVRYVVVHGAPASSLDAMSPEQLSAILRGLPASARAVVTGPDVLVDLAP